MAQPRDASATHGQAAVGRRQLPYFAPAAAAVILFNGECAAYETPEEQPCELKRDHGFQLRRPAAANRERKRSNACSWGHRSRPNTGWHGLAAARAQLRLRAERSAGAHHRTTEARWQIDESRSKHCVQSAKHYGDGLVGGHVTRVHELLLQAGSQWTARGRSRHYQGLQSIQGEGQKAQFVLREEA